jgi:hypothetical protein
MINREKTTSGLPQTLEDRLVAMWREGLPTKAIGLALDITKNAVVGRIRRLAEKGVVQQRPNPIPNQPKTLVVSCETPVVEEEEEEEVEPAPPTRRFREVEEALSEAAKAQHDKDSTIPKLPPVVYHPRASRRRMAELPAVDLPLAALLPSGEVFFFFGPSSTEPFIPPPEPRRGCVWIVSECQPGKRRWQGAQFCGKRPLEGGAYCKQHHSRASAYPQPRRNGGFVVY